MSDPKLPFPRLIHKARKPPAEPLQRFLPGFETLPHQLNPKLRSSFLQPWRGIAPDPWGYSRRKPRK